MSAPAAPRPAADLVSAVHGPLTVDRYIAALYPRFAWEAMVRLGDASTAGRLVERVLHRAWRERERFAAADALLRHAAESAEAAIAREEARRLSVTRFDPEDGIPGMPGDLSPLAMTAVVERLRTGRAPAPTPPAGNPTVRETSTSTAGAMPPAVIAAEPPSPTPPGAEPPAVPALELTGMHRANGRAKWATPHAPGTASSGGATGTHRAATAEHSRQTLRSARYIAQPAARRVSGRVLAIVAGVALVGATLAWRLASGPSGAEAARLAAADSTAGTLATSRGERRDSTLAPGLTASLGPSSLVRTPAALAQGIRGLAARGFVSVDAAMDSTHPVVLVAAGQRFEWPGGRVSLVTSGDTVLVFAEGAEVTHHGAAVTRIANGQSVRVTQTGGVEGLEREVATQRFSWRSGRLVTGPIAVRDLRPVVGTWFGLDLASDIADTVALDVPLDSAGALPAALSGNGRFEATLSGTRLAVTKPAPRPTRRRPAAPVEEVVELPVLRKLPGVP